MTNMINDVSELSMISKVISIAFKKEGEGSDTTPT